MEEIIILSRCGVRALDGYYQFNFKGVYKGRKIRGIKVFAENQIFKVNTYYLLKARVLSILDETLSLQCISSEELGELNFFSYQR